MWHNMGDRNTKFYHAITKQRRARNRIVGLYNKQDEWVTEEKEVEDVVTQYFTELFTTTGTRNNEDFLAEVPNLVTEQMNECLTRAVTEDEVRRAVFLIHPEKAPGPDGMTALFYQKSWGIIKNDIMEMVKNFFQSGSLDYRINLTNICMIPKTERPSRMTELRPISLCNVGYKIVSKILCQRLKQFLPGLVSETQSAFVTGRLISDNILIAQEMFHGLRTNKTCQDNYMAIKTDMSKAYDRIEWSFISKLFRKMGFAEKWISWIMGCIKSVRYKILINGQQKGFVVPTRGIRQGDPLSPYIFVLCTEALIANIKKAEREHQISGLRIARRSPPVSHLLFADDSLFFCKTNNEECNNLMHILKDYEANSGQQINFTKSSVQFGHRVSEAKRLEMMDILGITTRGGMGTYLGIPESLGGPKTQVFGFILDRLNNRVNGWAMKFLSKGGKEVLIKSVLTALPTYVMSCFRLTKAVNKKITSAIAQFWWSHKGNVRGMHWLAWEKLCNHKKMED